MKKLPHAISGLSFTEVGGETIVYDENTAQAHCLNACGGRVLSACRDQESREALEQELGSEQVESAIQELLVLGLLQDSTGVSRRGLLAAGATVLVASVTAPMPAAAASVNKCVLTSGGVPCNCTDCGLPCSGVQVQSCASPVGSGAPIPNFVCCFEYNTLFGSVGTCQDQGSGDYSCRLVNATNFAFDCETARTTFIGAGNQGQYYCCRCTLVPLASPNRTC